MVACRSGTGRANGDGDRKLCESFAVGEGDLRAGEVGWEVGGGREEVVGAEGEEAVKRFKVNS